MFTLIPPQLVLLKAKVVELQENEQKSIQEAESLRLTMQNTVSACTHTPTHTHTHTHTDGYP